jgi:hypothetical protein
VTFGMRSDKIMIELRLVLFLMSKEE